jgi:hypothetical protein
LKTIHTKHNLLAKLIIIFHRGIVIVVKIALWQPFKNQTILTVWNIVKMNYILKTCRMRMKTSRWNHRKDRKNMTSTVIKLIRCKRYRLNLTERCRVRMNKTKTNNINTSHTTVTRTIFFSLTKRSKEI